MKVEIRKNPLREEPAVIIETPILTAQVEELARRLEEMDDPEIGIDRMLEYYHRKGYSENWINQRLKSIEVHK